MKIKHLIPYRFRMFLQKLFRGYADDEVWNLGFSLCKWVHPRLKHLIENHDGYPSRYERFEEKNAVRAYNSDLKEMLWFVELIIRNDWKEMGKNKERMKRAEKLCGENIFYLWD
jgi:hypothetical protein